MSLWDKLTGEFIDAQEAYRLGAVERVVPLAQLLPTAREIAASESPPTRTGIRS